MNVFHYSIDIETLDTRNTSVVTSVGAYAFGKAIKPVMYGVHKNTVEGVEYTGREFQAQLDIDAQLRIDRTISAHTLRFWANQQKELFQKQLNGRVSVHDFTRALRNWMNFFESSQKEPDEKVQRRIWVYGPHFDVAILQGLYESQRSDTPWRYNEVRDVRTLVKMAEAMGHDTRAAAVNECHHDALSDAKAQAQMVLAASRLLGFDLDAV